LALYQGWYGERIAGHVAEQAPDWTVRAVDMGKGFPRLPDDETLERLAGLVAERVPSDAIGTDLMLFLAEETGACLLLPELASRLDVRAVICPVDDYRLVPRGLERQLTEELHESGVLYAFPRPFCSLSAGQGPISLFAERFGRPLVELELLGDVVSAVKVLRGAPCGSTHYMARRLVGARADEAPRLAGLYVQIYPCLASHVEDPVLGEDMIHISGTLAKAAVEKALAKALKLRHNYGEGE